MRFLGWMAETKEGKRSRQLTELFCRPREPEQESRGLQELWRLTAGLRAHSAPASLSWRLSKSLRISPSEVLPPHNGGDNSSFQGVHCDLRGIQQILASFPLSSSIRSWRTTGLWKQNQIWSCSSIAFAVRLGK